MGIIAAISWFLIERNPAKRFTPIRLPGVAAFQQSAAGCRRTDTRGGDLGLEGGITAVADDLRADSAVMAAIAAFLYTCIHFSTLP
jgi:hypothetical protein